MALSVVDVLLVTDDSLLCFSQPRRSFFTPNEISFIRDMRYHLTLCLYGIEPNFCDSIERKWFPVLVNARNLSLEYLVDPGNFDSSGRVDGLEIFGNFFGRGQFDLKFLNFAAPLSAQVRQNLVHEAVRVKLVGTKKQKRQVDSEVLILFVCLCLAYFNTPAPRGLRLWCGKFI